MPDEAVLVAGNALAVPSCPEVIRAGEEYGATYTLDYSAARGIVWLPWHFANLPHQHLLRLSRGM